MPFTKYNEAGTRCAIEHSDFKPAIGSDSACDGCAFNDSPLHDLCAEAACCGWDFPKDHPMHAGGSNIIWIAKQ